MFPINFFGYNGFEKSFGKKTNRPKPRFLQVDLKVLVKNEIRDLKFVSGRFDEKRYDKEKMIVGSSGEFLFVWSIKNIFSGDYVSREVVGVGKGVIRSEFQWEKDTVFAVMKNGVGIQAVLDKNKNK